MASGADESSPELALADRLSRALVVGDGVDLVEVHALGEVIDEGLMRGWGDSHDLPAADLIQLIQHDGRACADARPLGPIRVRGARIVGRLVLDFTTNALPFELIDCLLEEGVSARSAHLCEASFVRCRIRGVDQSAIDAQGMRVDHDLRLDGCIVTADQRHGSAVMLAETRISGKLSLKGARLSSETGPALDAEQCEIGTFAFLDEDFAARGSGSEGAVVLAGARVSGPFSLRSATLTNGSGPAINLQRAVLGGGLHASSLAACGNGCSGVMRINSAYISGQLALRESTILNKDGPGLVADGIHVTEGVYLENATVVGAGGQGAVRLLGAIIGGPFSSAGARFMNKTGAGLIGDRCRFSGGAHFGTCSVVGAGDIPALNLAGAQVTGDLSLRDSSVSSMSTTAVNLQRAKVSGATYLDGGFAASGAGKAPVLDLAHADVGVLRVTDRVEHASESYRRWNLDGCTYRDLPRPESRAWWLETFRAATASYASQPYQHLAAAYRSAGHDRDARAVLMAQRRDQITRGDLGLAERLWAQFTGLALGYGWAPWRALYGLIGVFAVSAALAVVLGAHGALSHPLQPGGVPQPCTVAERIGVGLDLGTPLLGSATRARDRCPISTDATSATTAAFIVSTWLLQLVAWGTAALFVAGFTGAVRKT